MDKLKPLIIGDLKLEVPIIQGGMGVRVSTWPLVSAVSNCGAGGTIASVGLCPDTEETRRDVPKSSREHLIKEIEETRKHTKSAFGVNIMVALSNYEDIVRTSVKEKVDYIISGAGLPLNLPEYVDGDSIKLIPLLASGRAAELVFRTWKRRYGRIPDAVVVEGPQSGGHIGGYPFEELESGHVPIVDEALKDVIEIAAKYEQEKGCKIPVIAAGGIFDGKDVARVMKLGASGVQIGSRFIATYECSVAQEYKDMYVNAGKEDLVIIKSPVGLPARVLRNKFINEMLAGGRRPIKCRYRCLRTCDPSSVPYCIAKALVDAVEGRMDDAVVFAGTNIEKIDKIVSVKDLLDEITTEAVEELNKDPEYAA